jgi:hypothetical protein
MNGFLFLEPAASAGASSTAARQERLRANLTAQEGGATAPHRNGLCSVKFSGCY